jgi:hypothetical protein
MELSDRDLIKNTVAYAFKATIVESQQPAVTRQ